MYKNVSGRNNNSNGIIIKKECNVGERERNDIKEKGESIHPHVISDQVIVERRSMMAATPVFLLLSSFI